jgi:hypothetical protein
LDCISADILPPLEIGLFFCLLADKKKSRKNGSPKKQNHWALPPECMEGSRNNIVQTLGVILHAAGILSRFFYNDIQPGSVLLDILHYVNSYNQPR